MSRNLNGNDSDPSFDIDELLRIGTMCMELRKEKDMLKESHSKSTELIRVLESDLKSLSEARLEDKKYIQELETELHNCSEEIETLQDQLNLRNIEANWLGEHVHSLELKLTEVSKLQENVNHLREELLNSNSERLFFMRELEKKEVELQNSKLWIEKLEDAASSTALDSECEIESMKLDLLNMERMSYEAREFQEKTTQEIATMDGLIQELATQIRDSQKVIELLEEENRDLRNKVETSRSIAGNFLPRIEEYLMEWLEKKDGSQLDFWPVSKPERKLHLSKETGISVEFLGTLLSELAIVVASDEHVKGEMERMLQKIQEYELLVEQLKVDYYKRAYILALCGRVLFPNASGRYVSLKYLTIFELNADLYNWGRAVLAFLYSSLKDFVLGNKYDIRGCIILLQDELREEKAKAKEEAEDLTQEMAELRYQITGMLEEECKRRARIEQASLQRIAELEAQVQQEHKKSFPASKQFVEVQTLAESRFTEISYQKKLLEGPCTNLEKNEACKCGECKILIGSHSEECSEAKYIVDFVNDDRLDQLSIACSPEEDRHLSDKSSHGNTSQ